MIVNTLVLDRFNDHPTMKHHYGKLFILNNDLYCVGETLSKLEPELTTDNIGEPYRSFISVGREFKISNDDAIVLINHCQRFGVQLNFSNHVLKQLNLIRV